ncbi:MAG: type II toxin-antitoxin system PemK/MazF family toxin [Myxococcales bacterium]|nr:type II toxin-antitoxin system PemK/MazF family toxin [Myxococcales bacterium]
MISRGEIRWFRFASPDKRRPVLILGREDVLPSLAQVPVVPLSTQVRGLAWEVALGPDDGLPTPCVLKPEWIRIVERQDVGPVLGRLPDARWPEVRAAILDVLGL